jgi:hypothetical protein
MTIQWLDKERPRFQTEAYVESPPAALIVDESGNVWTLGLQEKFGYVERRLKIEAAGWEFNVLLNGRSTGDWAAKIVRKNGRIAIFGSEGWKRWTGRAFV